MAKGHITMSGMDAIIKELNDLEIDMVDTVRASLTRSLTPIANQMKSNAVSMFNKGYSKGRMVASIGFHVGLNYDGIITASVGVYEYSKAPNDPTRRINAPLLAYFYETGIQPHSTANTARAGGKGRKAQGQNVGGVNGGSVAPKPFVSSAFYAGSSSIFINLDADLNNILPK